MARARPSAAAAGGKRTRVLAVLTPRRIKASSNEIFFIVDLEFDFEDEEIVRRVFRVEAGEHRLDAHVVLRGGDDFLRSRFPRVADQVEQVFLRIRMMV